MYCTAAGNAVIQLLKMQIVRSCAGALKTLPEGKYYFRDSPVMPFDVYSWRWSIDIICHCPAVQVICRIMGMVINPDGIYWGWIL